MPRAKTNKLYRTFIKGLISEASPLTYPENASINEDNTIIYQKGNRSRRYGLDWEQGAYLSSYSTPSTEFNTKPSIEYVWESVANDASVNFLCHQNGLTLYFYDLASTPISGGLKAFSINLSTYLAPTAEVDKVPTLQVAMSSGKGFLFITSAQLEPLIVEYSPVTDTITVTRIYIQIRDFKGVDDNLLNDEEPSTLTALHKYNLINQGWQAPMNDNTGPTVTGFSPYGFVLSSRKAPESTPIDDYFTSTSRYPGNNKQWWVAKDTDGNFDPALLEKQFYGANKAPRGHFVVNAFYIDRTAVSGVAGLTAETTIQRPNTCAFYGGRAWYGVNNTLYFSQILDEKGKAGQCYQVADPTSEDISDLVATDGGVIPIPEMGQLVSLVPSGGGLLVFANNGVWYLSGTSQGFTALDFSVSKVANIGTSSPLSIVQTYDQIYYWSRIGIQSLAPKSGLFGPIDGGFDKKNITELSIQSFFFEEISEECRQYVKGAYDPGSNTIQWLFRNDLEINKWVYNRVLNYDLTLDAFYPWTIDSTHCQVVGVINSSIPTISPKRRSFSKFLTAVPQDGVYRYTFSEFDSEDFCDWKSFDTVGVGYSSYVETGYELLDDAMRKKEANYVFCYFRRTEENFIDDGDGNYSADKPSSCYFQIKWAWSSSSISNKWSSKREVYRHGRVPFVNEDNLEFDTGYPIVITKNKVRGTGRAIQFRFESDAIGSNFDLLGWAVAYSGNTEV